MVSKKCDGVGAREIVIYDCYSDKHSGLVRLARNSEHPSDCPESYV
jgi:hypothetical protein